MKLQTLNLLLLLSAATPSSVLGKRDASKGSTARRLILYDPRSGRQLQPLSFRPPIVVGNKRKPLQANGNLVELPQLWNPCSCTELLCICCLGLRLGEGILNQRVCVTLKYNAARVVLTLSLNVNQRNIATVDIPARDPVPWCLPVLLPLPVYACLRVYDIRAQDGNVHVCVSLMLNVAANQLLQFPFDCVRFGISGITFLPPPYKPATATTGVSNSNPPNSFDSESSGSAPTDDGLGDDKPGTSGQRVADRRKDIQLEENYSGISVEQQPTIFRQKKPRG